MNSVELAWHIRRKAIDMVSHAHASHIGGILSVADIVSVLYTDILNIDARNPYLESRDRFILSKGHCGVAVYIALAYRGFFPVELLDTYGDNGSPFSCHISHKKVPGVEVTTGSLGHGVCMACGMALNGKLRHKDYKVYTIVGDGECNEGTVWEMALLAGQYKLDNFTVVIDDNKMQAMGFGKDILDMHPLGDKWRSFGWNVVEVDDGNDHEQLKAAFLKGHESRPKVIIAHTVKGKGISFMENELLWHYRDPQNESYRRAVNELEAVKYEESCDRGTCM